MLIQISGANETNQSSTTSVRSSRNTSPTSANVRAKRISEISSQMMRVRISFCNEGRGKNVSRRVIPSSLSVQANNRMQQRAHIRSEIARKKALYRRPDGRGAGVAKLGQRRRT